MWAKDLLKIAKVYCGWSIIAFTLNSCLYFQGSDLDQSSSSRRADSSSEDPARLKLSAYWSESESLL